MLEGMTITVVQMYPVTCVACDGVTASPTQPPATWASMCSGCADFIREAWSY